MNLVFSTRLPRIGLAALALIAAGIAAPRLASAYPIVDSSITIAAPTIDITPAQAAAGYSGYFDVTITDTSTQNIAQFQATLSLAGNGSQVALVGGDLGQLTNGEYNDPSSNGYGGGASPTPADGIGDAAGSSPSLLYPYILGNVYATVNSGEVTNGGVVSVSDANDAGNSDLTNSGTVSMTAGTTYSLMQIYFTVAPGTGPGSYALSFDTNAPYNNTAGQNTNDPLANFVNLISPSNTTSYAETSTSFGAIVVQSPEPASVLLMLFGVVGLIGYGVRRARRA
jgi:hypothetical protein